MNIPYNTIRAPLNHNAECVQFLHEMPFIGIIITIIIIGILTPKILNLQTI